MNPANEQLSYPDHTILIAEDDEANFQYFQQTAKAAGIKIVRAENGLEAIKQCENHPEIRLILMDGMMPVMTGYEATRTIRKIRPDLPIVILTAYVSKDSIRDAVLSGCNDYLAKPIGTEELRMILKKWLVP